MRDELYLDGQNTIADRIVADLHPKTVLDAGCATGHLVTALRDRGVEAYGVGISWQAFRLVREDCKPYCLQGDICTALPEGMPQQYDLIVSTAVLETMSADDGAKAIANLCALTDTVIFSATPDDYADITHINVQQREYWANLFAQNDMADDLYYRPTYIAEYAVCYRRVHQWCEQVMQYERYVQTVEAQLKNVRQELNAQLLRIDQLQAENESVTDAFFWKITKPLRAMSDYAKHTLRNCRIVRQLWAGMKSIKLVVEKLALERLKPSSTLYKMCKITKTELNRQRNAAFSKDIVISIIVPLYNTPESYLRDMIRSVQSQTYRRWELCMADGSDTTHSNLERICEAFCKSDARIRYKKLEENLGIAGNSNACLEMANGDYIGILDHDDILHPATLYTVMRAICEKDADMLYTDEVEFHKSVRDVYNPVFKPDYAPDTLRSNHYICHFLVCSKALLTKAGGGFRTRFDKSQDYDLILRLSEQAKSIVHIPKLLYFQRGRETPVEKTVNTSLTAKMALAEHLQRVGLDGIVEDSSVPSTYRIQYTLAEKPMISIIIPNKDHVDDLSKCLYSIQNKSTYSNWEIVIVENNSTERKTFDYYESIQKDSRIHVITRQSDFNYSTINNYAACSAKGSYLVLLNNDVEIITPDWLEQLLMFAQRKDVGAVGCMLYYPGDTIQHAGVIVGMGGVAGHLHKNFPKDSLGYMCRLTIAQNFSAVTAACMMVPRTVWNEMGGLDKAFQIAFNDVDLCMRIRKAGYLIVWTPYAELYHYESKSRGAEDTEEKQLRFNSESRLFRQRWKSELDAGDPYYNCNLTLGKEDCSMRSV